MVSGSRVFLHSRPALHDLIVMVTREDLQKDDASDYPKLTIGTRIVCQARAGWAYDKRNVAGASLLVGPRVSIDSHTGCESGGARKTLSPQDCAAVAAAHEMSSRHRGAPLQLLSDIWVQVVVRSTTSRPHLHFSRMDCKRTANFARVATRPAVLRSAREVTAFGQGISLSQSETMSRLRGYVLTLFLRACQSQLHRCSRRSSPRIP